MEMRRKVVGELAEWTEVPIQSSRQADGCSCGPFVLMVSHCRFAFNVVVIDLAEFYVNQQQSNIEFSAAVQSRQHAEVMPHCQHPRLWQAIVIH